jgi:hypothetical protein
MKLESKTKPATEKGRSTIRRMDRATFRAAKKRVFARHASLLRKLAQP